MTKLDQNLETERLVLRMVRESDMPEIAAMHADPQVMALSGAGGVLDEQATTDYCRRIAEHWQHHGYGTYVIAIRDTGEFCGLVGLRYRAEFSAPELSWILPQAQWGNGYAIEAARAVKDHVFARLDIAELYHFIDPENTRSIRLAKKLGAVPREEITAVVDGVERVVDIMYVSQPS